jgi:hypothetical protein
MKNRSKISSGKQWGQREKEFLIQGLQNNLLLSELLGQLPGRSPDAIIGQAHKLNYAERKQPNGDKTFIFGISHRGISSKRSAENDKESVPAVVDFEAYKDTQIIAKKPKLSTKELRMQALDFLYEKDLMINDQSVKHTIKLLTQFRKDMK